MPEGIEVEYYRKTALKALNRKIKTIENIDHKYLSDTCSPADFRDLLIGNCFTGAERKGKLLILSISNECKLGLRFGMTGRLLIDGNSAIKVLEYSSEKDNPDWDRLSMKFQDGGSLSIRDPRRLGAAQINPDLDGLGTDLYKITALSLSEALKNSTRPVKARLMDQSKIAGLGNLLTDEILWRSSIDPRRGSNTLSYNDMRRLLRHTTRTISELTNLGGSHMGNLQNHRVPGGLCPKDGVPLNRYKLGGRTTYSCPQHQR
ncbi:MAG: DNA-formamidopyrimidine glycosylase family protein [Acidimicrobiales bacterium]